jgi:hypothetical protein
MALSCCCPASGRQPRKILVPNRGFRGGSLKALLPFSRAIRHLARTAHAEPLQFGGSTWVLQPHCKPSAVGKYAFGTPRRFPLH